VADVPIWVAVEGAEQLRDLTKRLKAQGDGRLQKKLRSSIRQAAKPAEADVRASVMRVKVTSSRGGRARPVRSRGLRARTARAVGTSVSGRGTIRIRVSAQKFGEYGRTLPKYLDAELNRYQRWRHPVFGNQDNWVAQRGDPYFFSAVRRHRRDFRRAVFAAMDDIADQITE
jgi:hypothetical protein